MKVKAKAEATPSVLARLQRGLESLYRVETRLEVDAFLVGELVRDGALRGALPRRPREQLLLSQSKDDLHLALFLDRDALANLKANDPSDGLSEQNFWDFCLAVEGVSHFIYAVVCAMADRTFSALELELQAEVDKFVSCYLVQDRGGQTADLRRRLYHDVRLSDDLDDEERARYQTANDEARRYVGSLERRYLGAGRVAEMLIELRLFYRLGLTEKLRHIAKAA